MSYVLMVLCYNEVHYLNIYESLFEAENQAILLANEWYNKDGILEFTSHQLETIKEMKSYYRSDSYFNSGDYAHVLMAEVVL